MQRMCSNVHFFFSSHSETEVKAGRRSGGKCRFDNQLPVAGHIAVGAKALAAQVLLEQARKEAADAE